LEPIVSKENALKQQYKLMAQQLGYQFNMKDKGAAAAQNMDLTGKEIGLRQQLKLASVTEPMIDQLIAKIKARGLPMTTDSASAVMSSQPSSLSPDQFARAGAPGAPAPVGTPQGQQPAPQQGGGGSDFLGASENQILGSLLPGGGGLGKAVETANAPTDIVKNLVAAGIDPRSPEGIAWVKKFLSKETNIPLVAGRAGAPMYNTDGTIAAMAPKIPDNAVPIIDKGQVVGTRPLPGAAAIEGGNKYAEATGKAYAEPQAGFRGNQPVFTSKGAAAGAPPPLGAPGNKDNLNPMEQQSLRGAYQQAKASGNAPDVQFYERMYPWVKDDAAVEKPIAPSAPLGAEKGQEASQSDLATRYNGLRDQVNQVQTTNSYLESIKQQAKKAAVGPMSDKIDYLNGLLAASGVSQRAKDAVTANDLMEKFHNQIVARLGASGALGTDAARTLLSAAFPNTHMTEVAIDEAANNLVAANNMLQAKLKLVQTHGNNRDPIAYQQTEQNFDLHADPRIWQLKNMKPDDAAKYLKELPPQVQNDLRVHAQALKKMGAL
jgi:hypothetical protein